MQKYSGHCRLLLLSPLMHSLINKPGATGGSALTDDGQQPLCP